MVRDAVQKPTRNVREANVIEAPVVELLDLVASEYIVEIAMKGTVTTS